MRVLTCAWKLNRAANFYLARSLQIMTLHHEMSRNVPERHFHVLYILKVNSMLFTMVKTIFKSED